MKWLFIYAAFLFGICPFTSAQHSFPGFLFDKFEKGKIIYKTGNQATTGMFNYNTVDEKLLFVLQDTIILELERPDIVAELIILDRVFEHAGNGIFYEKIKTGDNFFYVRWLTKIIYDEKEGGYGTRPATGAIDKINQINSTGGSFYKFDTQSNYRLMTENIYYLKAEKGFKRFASFDVLAKQFKNCKDRLKLFVKDENLNFKQVNDVAKAVMYGFENCK